MNWIGIGMYLHSQIVAGPSHSVSHSVHFLSDHVLLRCLNLLHNSFQHLSLGNYLLSCFFVQRLQWKAKLVDNGGFQQESLVSLTLPQPQLREKGAIVLLEEHLLGFKLS